MCKSAKYDMRKESVFKACFESATVNMSERKNQPRAGKASVLGIVLVICLLLLSIVTLATNLIFRDASAVPTMFGHRYYVYGHDDMETADEGATIPAGAMVILDDEDTAAPAVNQIVLYRSTTGECRIGQVSLVLNESTEESAPKQTVYYLTTAKNASAIAVSENDIVGVCRQRSTELGAVVRFLTSTAGLVVCMILPCVAVLLYVAALFVAAKEEADDDDDDDTDLMFVKALQSKKKALDQKAAAAEQTVDDRSAIVQEAAETEAAIRRAERFAAIRKSIEGHRTSPDTAEVPLYTTASRPAVSTTKQIAAPDPELMDIIAGRSAHATEPIAEDATDALIARLAADKAQQEIAAEPQITAAAPQEPVLAAQEEKTAPVTKSAPEAKPAPAATSAPKAKPAAPKTPAAKPASKSSAVDFNDLMAMLDAAQKNLDE